MQSPTPRDRVLRGMDMANYDVEVARVFELYNQTWADNWMDAPYTQVVQRGNGRNGGPVQPDVPALNAKFDELLHYPSSAYVDPSLAVADDEWIINVRNFAPAKP